MHSELTMTVIVICGVAVPALLSLGVGLLEVRTMKGVADLFPMLRGHQARIRSKGEFSSATVAATLSLATVVTAYFELAADLGLWLLWTVVTTAAGIFAVRLVAPRIWQKLQSYGDRIPTLHEFLGKEYSSPMLVKIAASATTLGFLAAFAVELTVGSRLFSGLVPQVPASTAVIVLALIGLTYTSAGGFRAVIITDRIQMMAIWLFLCVLAAYYVVRIHAGGGLGIALAKMPSDSVHLTYRTGLISFLIGIFVINVPTYIADMGMWQRMTSVTHHKDTFGGLGRSAAYAALSWGGLALLAVFVPMLIQSTSDVNPLLTLLHSISQQGLPVAIVVLFPCIVGLYAAMMSTASTQLIAASHAIHQDVLGARTSSSGSTAASLTYARSLLIGAAAVAVGVVELFYMAGFSIADLVFAIYGAQLGLCPPVLMALFLSRERLIKLRSFAVAAIVGGFVAGWTAAIVGKAFGNSNWIFLAPAVSLAASLMVLGVGVVSTGGMRDHARS